MNNLTNLNKDNASLNNLTRFNAYHDNRYLDPFINGYALIFITKPSLFIDSSKPSDVNDYKATLAYNNMLKDPKFVSYIDTEAVNENDKILPKLLSYNKTYSKSNFLHMFTNGARSFDIQDMNMDQQEAFQTKQGFKMVLPSNKTMSSSAGTVNIPVMETSNLDFIKLTTLWVDYMSNVTDGTFSANPDMIINGELDYTSSIFYFVTEPDGKTLKYWSKFTGCWPTTIPTGSLSYRKGEEIHTEIDIPFNYMIREDMNPLILEEFNKISMKIDSSTAENMNLKSTNIDVKNNKYLNPNLLLNSLDTTSGASSRNREPLILYNAPKTSTNVDMRQGKFELVFGQDTYLNKFLNETLNKDGNNHYIYKSDEMFSSEDLDGSEGVITWTIK